ncbi:MAG: hypothetical protein AB8V23_04740 [Candidatus Midichloria sp.]|uniref:Uncharacterized protein n=1 Tax=Hyalomma marginatum TaxID=34627 RepID=A0A8S4C525_9ACAR|nr:hypothetical protein MHYMCMPSP_01009 [Hyalomma marginatum]CAG7598054.1 hypothetical protein MHYMCMPASI_00986 [Hyalomma marginatum]
MILLSVLLVLFLGVCRTSILIYGQSTPLELSSLNGTNGFIINGIDLGDNVGYSVASAGDLNSGGKDAPNAGQAHVIYGEVFE